MNRAEINEKIVAIIASLLKIGKDAIRESSTLESLGADSINRVEFVMELEETFGVEINDEEAEKLETVGQAVDYISQLLNQ